MGRGKPQRLELSGLRARGPPNRPWARAGLPPQRVHLVQNPATADPTPASDPASAALAVVVFPRNVPLVGGPPGHGTLMR